MATKQTTEEASQTEAQLPKLWLTIKEAAPVIGDDPPTIWRDIRENQFPFEFVRCGKRIKISARSLGLLGGEVATV